MFSSKNDEDLEEYDGSDTEIKEDNEPTNDEENVAAAQGAAEPQGNTTASCDSKEVYTKVGTPILSITFSLSEEHPFEVNVGAGMTANYKRSEKKAFPVLCEIKDFASDSEVKIESLKNKGCISKNLPKVLAPYLTELNRLLLDQYNLYYDSTKYDEFVTAQSAFLEAQRQKPAKKVEEEEEGEEKQQEQEQQEPPLTPDQEERKRKLNQNVLNVLRDGATKINVGDADVRVKIEEISKKNRIGKSFTDFLADELARDKKKYHEMFPLYLLKQTYDGNERQQLILTNNGIITNGNLIFSYLNVNFHDRKIFANTIALGGERLMWTLKNEYQHALDVLNGTKKDEDFISDKLINDGFPEQGLPQKGGIGNRKTLSKKLFKKRATRRIRK